MRNNKGFSLVELIVVIAIMAILAAVAVVGVSVYIPKAQQANDKQLAADIEYAFKMNAYNYPNGVADFVIITTTGANAKEGGFADEALTDMYGSNWRNELKLHYNEWSADNSMLNAALNADKVAGSSYLTNSSVSELLGNVQDVTSAAAGLLGSVSKSENQYLTLLEASMGTDYMEKAVSSGVIGKNDSGYYLLPGTYSTDANGNVVPTEDLQTQLSNLMVFGVAGQLKDAEPLDMANMMLSGLNPEGTTVDTTKYDVGTVMAAQYALYKAYAVDKGGAALESFNRMNDAMATAGSKADAENALNTFVTENRAGLEEYVEQNEGENVYKNAKAVTQILGGVNTAAPDYSSADVLSNSSLFTSNEVTGDINMFVGMASVELTAAQRAELQQILAANPNAVVVMINNGQIISSIGE